MAYKRKRSSSKRPIVKRRRMMKRRGSSKSYLRIKRSPFPMSTTVTLKYCTTVQLDCTAASAANHVFRANSIFDPDYTGTGHQPYAHDTYASIYTHYKVLKAAIKCNMVAVTPDASQSNSIVGIAVRDLSTIELNPDTLREEKGTRFATLVSSGKASVSNGFNFRKQWPINPQAGTAQFGANPTEEAFFHVFGIPINTAIDPGAVSVQITIYYTCKFWELKNFGAS